MEYRSRRHNLEVESPGGYSVVESNCFVGSCPSGGTLGQGDLGLEIPASRVLVLPEVLELPGVPAIPEEQIDYRENRWPSCSVTPVPLVPLYHYVPLEGGLIDIESQCPIG